MEPDPRLQEQIEHFEEQLQANPDSLVFARLADLHRKADDPRRALEILDDRLDRHPDYASGHIVRGRCLRDLGEDEEARQAFERVLELDGQNLVALRALADLARERGDRGEARRRLEALLEVDPGNEPAREMLDELAEDRPAAGEPGERPPGGPAPGEPTAEEAPGDEAPPEPGWSGPGGEADGETGEDGALAEPGPDGFMDEELPGPEPGELAGEEPEEPELEGPEGEEAELEGPEAGGPSAEDAGEDGGEQSWWRSFFPGGGGEEEPPGPDEGETATEEVEEAGEPEEDWEDILAAGETTAREEPPEAPAEDAGDAGPAGAGADEETSSPAFGTADADELRDRIEELDASDRELATETLAGLYEAQGFHRQAVEMYEELVEQRPDDPELRRRLERAREALEAVGGREAGSADGPPAEAAAPPPSPETVGAATDGDEEEGTTAGTTARDQLRALLRGEARPGDGEPGAGSGGRR